MILLAEDCLVFETASGEGVPFSAEMISVELIGDTEGAFDPDFVRHAAAAVFHYFRNELGRTTVTVAEFTEALEKVLRGTPLVKPDVVASPIAPLPPEPSPGLTAPPVYAEMAGVVPSDLSLLAGETGEGGELLFFPRLRDELRARLRQTPQVLCFQGLRPCVKQLVGTRRWSPRCQILQDQIEEYLRHCVSQESAGATCSLMVK